MSRFPTPNKPEAANAATVRPFPALVTIIVLALAVQTAYIPQYCRNEARGSTAKSIVDRSLTHDYCYASQMRDRNAPVAQWIDTLNYDLVALGNLLGGLIDQLESIQQPHK